MVGTTPFEDQPPTKVVHFTKTWLPQTEAWQFNQVRFLPQSVESHIACEHTENLSQFALPNLVSLRQRGYVPWVRQKAIQKLGARSYLPFVLDEVKRHQASTLHLHFGNVGWEYADVARKAGLKTVVSFYGYDMSQLPRRPEWRMRFRDMFTKVDRVITVWGGVMAQQLIDLGCPPEKLVVHHLGIDSTQIPYRPRTWNGIEPLRILVASSFREKKGIPYAIDAVSRLAQRIPVELTVIGDANPSPESQEEKRKILARIQESGIAGRARLLGLQPNAVMLEEAYRNHIYLAPSVTASNGDTEGGAPMAVAEMQATGLPVIATRHCDIGELVKDRASGILVDERDVAGLTEALIWMAENPQQWESLAGAARANVEQEFDAHTQGLRLASLYHDLSLS
jgi:colanic acid/amylovoran biosynthesis glycosyltransferase